MSSNSDIRRQHTKVDLLWHQEDFRRYVDGGYHPVALGDTLHNGRYSLCHKLGWGGFSLVWLARDLHENKWVAIKIIRADASKSANEYRMLSRISPSDSSFIVRLLDQFMHQGSNGSHLCLVFNLLGPSLHQVIEVCREAAEIEEVEFYEFLKPKVIFKVTQQLLTAVAYLHEAGFVHGDITPKNIAFTTHLLSKLQDDAFFEVIGKPRTEPVSRKDGRPLHKGIPTQLTDAVTWTEWSDESKEDIRLLDFGCAFPQSDSKPKVIHQPSQFQAPETLLMNNLDFRSDLWSVGVVIYSLLFSYTSFYFGGDVATAISQMADFVGDFPTEWKPQYDRLGGDAIKKHTTPKIDLELKYVQSRTLKPLFPVLRGLLRMRPSERITAREALELISSATSHRVTQVHPRRQGLRSRNPKRDRK